jgi:hypothetical protein
MHHFAAVSKSTNKVVNKIVAVRGSYNPDQGDITFIPLKDGYTVDIGSDWSEDQRWTGDSDDSNEPAISEEASTDFLKNHGMLPADSSDSGSWSDGPAVE